MFHVTSYHWPLIYDLKARYSFCQSNLLLTLDHGVQTRHRLYVCSTAIQFLSHLTGSTGSGTLHPLKARDQAAVWTSLLLNVFISNLKKLRLSVCSDKSMAAFQFLTDDNNEFEQTSDTVLVSHPQLGNRNHYCSFHSSRLHNHSSHCPCKCQPVSS